MALQQVGRSGYEKMIREDIELSKLLFDLADNHHELEALSHNLSIATFRFIPLGYKFDIEDKEAYLNTLNENLLDRLQQGGEVFLSNAIINEKYALRGCIVNFRTSRKDIEEIIDIVVRQGQKMHERLQMDKQQEQAIGL